ncbi:MAG TPA: DUF2975 domain-containing protein [Kineosporiaceae bacterium]|nr:DUF2975 domain-containing protein [Kineosporiaceae bacterium]
MLGTLTALSAVTVVVIGALALTGRVTYPVDISRGPFSIHDGVSMPVDSLADVCQKANVSDQEAPSHCLRFFVHDGNSRSGDNGNHVQDANVRPTFASLTGTVNLATTGGWSALVAVSVVRKAIGLIVISGVLLLLWRLLANSAKGDVFSARAVRHVRGIGWLLIIGNVVDALVANVAKGEYHVVAFGPGPLLQYSLDAQIELAQLAFGGLILLLAEAFRHGAAVAAEQRLTV